MKRRVVNTRASHQAAEFDAILRHYNFEPVAFPTIAIAPPEDPTPLDQSIEQAIIGAYDWLVLTSANTVHMLHERIQALGHSSPILNTVDALWVAAVGDKTAEAARELLHLKINLTPDDFTADHLAQTLAAQPSIQQATIWLPQSAIAKDTLATQLQAIAGEVVVVPAYRNVLATTGDPIRPQLPEIDAITFTSGSTARNFRQRLHDEGGQLSDLGDIVIACIGPKTADEASKVGYTVHVVPDDYTLEGLASALADHFASR